MNFKFQSRLPKTIVWDRYIFVVTAIKEKKAAHTAVPKPQRRENTLAAHGA